MFQSGMTGKSIVVGALAGQSDLRGPKLFARLLTRAASLRGSDRRRVAATRHPVL
jgi:hypothetical protein